MNKRAVFIDRDGTIIRNIIKEGFDHPVAPWKFEELKFFPKVKEGLKVLKKMGFLIVLVTNQPDVAYGYVSQEEWEKIQNKVAKLGFDDIFMCRHRREDGCPFKKPSPMMLIAAADKWGIDLRRSYMVGDTEYDTGAGKSAGCTTILVDADYNRETESHYRVKDFWAAVQLIKALEIVMNASEK